MEENTQLGGTSANALYVSVIVIKPHSSRWPHLCLQALGSCPSRESLSPSAAGPCAPLPSCMFKVMISVLLPLGTCGSTNRIPLSSALSLCFAPHCLPSRVLVIRDAFLFLKHPTLAHRLPFAGMCSGLGISIRSPSLDTLTSVPFSRPALPQDPA